MQLFSRCCLLPQMEVHLGGRHSISRASNLWGCGEERDSKRCHYYLMTIIHYTFSSPPVPLPHVTHSCWLLSRDREAGGLGSLTYWFPLRIKKSKANDKVANPQSLQELPWWWKITYPTFFLKGAQIITAIYRARCWPVCSHTLLWFANPPNDHAQSYFKAFALLSLLAGNVLAPDAHTANSSFLLGPGLSVTSLERPSLTAIHHSLPFYLPFIIRYLYICSLSLFFL